MKKLENLDVKLPHPDPDENPTVAEQQQKDLLSYRKMLRLLCINARAKDVNDADQCDQARLKLSQIESTVLFEDSEFKAVMERIESNQMNWPNWMMSEMLRFMRAAAKNKIEIKEA